MENDKLLKLTQTTVEMDYREYKELKRKAKLYDDITRIFVMDITGKGRTYVIEDVNRMLSKMLSRLPKYATGINPKAISWKCEDNKIYIDIQKER